MGHYGHKETLGRKKAPSIEGALEIKQFQKDATFNYSFCLLVASKLDGN